MSRGARRIRSQGCKWFVKDRVVASVVRFQWVVEAQRSYR